MDGKTFAKLCRDCLVDERFTPTDVDLLFGKVAPRGQRRISLSVVFDALKLIAEKKGVPSHSVRKAVAECCGPILHATATGAVRLHDDKSTYTGVHAHRCLSCNRSGDL